MMRRFSLRTLLSEALTGHQGWERQWRSPEPKATYDAVIVGGLARGKEFEPDTAPYDSGKSGRELRRLWRLESR